jgi:2'-5' RNA ligase
MKDFFTPRRGRWPAGREHLHWHALLDPEWTHEHLCEPYSELTGLDAGLVPVQPRSIHITVLHVARPFASLTEPQLQEMTAAMREECATLPPFDVTIERPQVSGSALVCPIRPGQQMRALWQCAADISRSVLGDDVAILPSRDYYPHVSLGYATREVESGPFKVWLSDCAHEPVRVTITGVTAVAQQHDEREITWRALCWVPLIGGMTRHIPLTEIDGVV